MRSTGGQAAIDQPHRRLDSENIQLFNCVGVKWAGWKWKRSQAGDTCLSWLSWGTDALKRELERQSCSSKDLSVHCLIQPAFKLYYLEFVHLMGNYSAHDPKNPG